MRQVPTTNYYRQIITLFILIIVDELGFWVLLPVLAPLISTSAESFLQHASSQTRHLLFGVIMAISPFCSILSAPLLGYISDQIGRKKVLIICLTGTLIGFILYTFSFWYMNLLLLILARIIVGLTTASQGIVQAAMIDLSDPQRKANNIAIVACAMTLPLVIGPLLGGYLSDPTLVSWFNRSTPFIFITILSLLNLVMLCISFKETLTTNANNKHLSYLIAIADFFKQTNLRNLLIAFFLMELGWSLYFQDIPLLLVEKWHYTNSQLGLFISFIGACMALALMFLTRLFLKIISVNNMLKFNLILVLFALLLSFILSNKTIIWSMAIFVAIGIGLSYTAFITLLSNQVAESKQGLLMGFTDALLFLAFASTGLLAGILSIFSAKLPLLIAGIFILGGYLINFSLKNPSPT